MEIPVNCPEHCPGCRGKSRPAAEILAEKEKFVRRTLAPWRAAVVPVTVAGEAQEKGYRDKVCLAAEWDGHGWRLGFRRRQAVVAIPDCPLHSARVRAAALHFSKTLPPADVLPLVYYLQSGAQVTLVVKAKVLPDTGRLTASLAERLTAIGVEGLWLHLHPAAGRRVTAAGGWHLIRGQPESRDAAGLVYGPTAFRQPVFELHNRSLEAAEVFLRPAAGDLVFDLYCGLGHGLVRWTKPGVRVIGVEVHGESTTCARKNAPAAEIFRGTVHNRLPQLTAALKDHPGRRLVYVNPPRTGLEPTVTDWLTDFARPEAMVYLSCNAATLKRDLDRLTAVGYKITRIIPYDFFPGTRCLETQVFLKPA